MEADYTLYLCLACESEHVETFEDYGATGVVAPDGGCEYRYETGVYCLECGAREDSALTVHVCLNLDVLAAMERAAMEAPLGEPETSLPFFPIPVPAIPMEALYV